MADSHTRRTSLPIPHLGVRPVAEAWDWQLQARCRMVDPELFFHPDRERSDARQRRERRAKQVCASCPVKARCAEFALRARVRYGTWGGVSEGERKLVLDRIEGIRRPSTTVVQPNRGDEHPRCQPESIGDG
jgi:WhiB family redox-sensing transcriptional regulator